MSIRSPASMLSPCQPLSCSLHTLSRVFPLREEHIRIGQVRVRIVHFRLARSSRAQLNAEQSNFQGIVEVPSEVINEAEVRSDRRCSRVIAVAPGDVKGVREGAVRLIESKQALHA